jgi:flagellar biosynthesis protein FlhG
MANIKYTQKQALRKFVQALRARYVLLDLSAGTAFNTLDLFLEANSGIVVTTPERPAIMSTLVFLKSLVLRAIDQSLRRDTSMTEKLKQLHKQGVKDQVFSVARFRSQLMETNPEAAAEIEAICRRLRPRFLYNMKDELNDTEIFARIDQTLEELLAIEGDHLGVVPYDSMVRKWLKQPGIFKIEAPDSPIAQSIDRITRRIIRYWHMPLPGSAEALRERFTEYASTLFPERSNEKVPDL